MAALKHEEGEQRKNIEALCYLLSSHKVNPPCLLLATQAAENIGANDGRCAGKRSWWLWLWKDDGIEDEINQDESTEMCLSFVFIFETVWTPDINADYSWFNFSVAGLIQTEGCWMKILWINCFIFIIYDDGVTDDRPPSKKALFFSCFCVADHFVLFVTVVKDRTHIALILEVTSHLFS